MAIQANSVRNIKLGRGISGWEARSLDHGEIHFGYARERQRSVALRHGCGFRESCFFATGFDRVKAAPELRARRPGGSTCFSQRNVGIRAKPHVASFATKRVTEYPRATAVLDLQV